MNKKHSKTTQPMLVHSQMFLNLSKACLSIDCKNTAFNLQPLIKTNQIKS